MALIDSFTPAMREADDDVFRRARVIVDTCDGMRERGDATVPRRDAEEITVFKAVGSAIADPAVAQFFLCRDNETPTTGTGAIR